MNASIEPEPDPHLDALLAEAGWVLALAKRLARDQAAAEDIAQSTLALALERRPSVDGSLRPWLAKVVGRLARRTTRGEARRQVREAQSAPSRNSKAISSDEVLERFELQRDLAKRVSALSEPYRGVLIRTYYEGLTAKEIARATGASPATVRSQLARGLERLRLQYDQGLEGYSALGAFLIAAGSSSGFLSRRTAQIVSMQTSTKVAVAAAVVLAGAVAVIGTNFGQSDSTSPDRAGTPNVRDQLAHVAGDANSIVTTPAQESGRMAVQAGTVAVPADAEVQIAAADAEPAISTLRARILGEDLKPLAGATLSSIHPDGEARGTNNVAVSDNAGRVVLELTDDSMRMSRSEVYDMTFAASAGGHATKFLIKQPRLHAETDLGDLRLGPGGALVGTSVDVEGRAIAGALLVAGASVLTGDLDTLRIRGPELGVARPRATSAADGRFELPGIPAGSADTHVANTRLWAHAPGHLWTITEPFAIDPRGVVDVGRIVLEEVPSELRVEGVVLRPDGRPAPGARVGFASTGNPYVGHVMADERGHFMVVAKDEAPMDLIARDPDDRFGMSSGLIAERGEIVELRLMQQRFMSITVLDTDGYPLRDVHLMPILIDGPPFLGTGSDGGRMVPGEGWSYTDEAGHLSMPVPGQSFALSVRNTDYSSKSFGPYERDSAPQALTITLPRGAEVTGHVLAYGEPVEGARVAAMRRHEGFVAMTGGFPNRYPSGVSSVLTDSQGRFTAPLKQDWSWIGVLASRDGLAAGEITLELPAGEGARNLEIHLTEGGAIEGAVIPPPGMQAPGLYVAASRGDGLPISTLVDAEGRYRLEGLTPGDWRVEGRLFEVRKELLSTSRHPDDMEPRWNAFVVDRETLILEVDMRDLGDVEVQGRLRIDGAAPLRGWSAKVVLPRHARGPSETPAVKLDSDGRFAFTARPGRVDLRLVGPLPGGASVEMLREVHLLGPRFDWEGTLETAHVEELLEGDPERARFVRGTLDRGDRELTIAPVDGSGFLMARVPVGSSSLQVPATDPPSDRDWNTVRVAEVP